MVEMWNIKTSAPFAGRMHNMNPRKVLRFGNSVAFDEDTLASKALTTLAHAIEWSEPLYLTGKVLARKDATPSKIIMLSLLAFKVGTTVLGTEFVRRTPEDASIKHRAARNLAVDEVLYVNDLAMRLIYARSCRLDKTGTNSLSKDESQQLKKFIKRTAIIHSAMLPVRFGIYTAKEGLQDVVTAWRTGGKFPWEGQ